MPKALPQALGYLFRRSAAALLENARERRESPAMAATPSATTDDSFYDGAVTLTQPARGYRVNVDALFLAAFAAKGRHAQVAVDIGAGVGAVAVGLHHLGAATRVELVEREPDLAELARGNLARAGLRGAAHVADLSGGLPPFLRATADLVVANPPFFTAARGRPGAPGAEARARFGELEPFVAAAAQAINGSRARVAFVYPARELVELLRTTDRVGLIPKRLRLVHADASAAARVALLELQRAKPGGLVIEPPLFEWAAAGVRTEEVTRILRGDRITAREPANGRK